MILSEILARLYERLNYQSSPAAAVTTRLTNSVNEAQRRLLREPGLARLRDTTTGLILTSASGRAIYGLPPVISRVRAITDRTNDRQLSVLTVGDLRAADPGLDSTGTPFAFAPLGYKPYSQPPVATGLWIVSDSAADVTPLAVQSNGIRTGGLVTGDVSTTLTGTTRAAVGTATDYVDLQSLSLSAVCAGTISVYDAAAAGNLIAQIAPSQTYAEYYCIQFYPAPTATVSYYVDGALKAPLMDDAQDSPALPEEFHELLVYGALVLEYEKQDDPRLVLADRLYREGLSALKFHLAAPPAERPRMGRMATPRLSRLGSWTPSGSGW
jgi:hypothetical protein